MTGGSFFFWGGGGGGSKAMCVGLEEGKPIGEHPNILQVLRVLKYTIWLGVVKLLTGMQLKQKGHQPFWLEPEC